MPQTDHHPPGPPPDGSASGAPALVAALRELCSTAVPEVVAATVVATVRTTLVMMTAGLDQEARRNAWAATSEGAARARTRREAEAAVHSARIHPAPEGPARAMR